MIYTLKGREFSEKTYKGIITRSLKASPGSFQWSLLGFTFVKTLKVLPSQTVIFAYSNDNLHDLTDYCMSMCIFAKSSVSWMILYFHYTDLSSNS